MGRFLGTDNDGTLFYEQDDGSVLEVPGQLAPSGPGLPPTSLSAQLGMDTSSAIPSPPPVQQPIDLGVVVNEEAAQIPTWQPPQPVAVQPPAPQQRPQSEYMQPAAPMPPATEQPPIGVDPNAYETDLRRVYGAQTAAAVASADIESRRAEMRSAGAMARAADNQRRLLEEEKAGQAYREQTERDFVALAAEVKALKETEIKPNLSTGQMIAGLIGAAIAGYLNPRGPNSVVAVLENVIERDIQTQKANLASKFALLGESKEMIREKRFAAKDELDRQYKLRMAYFDAAGDEVDAMLSQYDNPAIQARLLGTKASIDEKLLKEVTDYRIGKAKTDQETWAERQRIAVQRSQESRANEQWEREKTMMDAPEALLPTDPRAIIDPATDRLIGVMVDKDEGKKLRDLVGSSSAMTAGIARLIEKARRGTVQFKGNWQKYIGSTEGQEVLSEYNTLLAEYIKSISGAQATDQEAERLKMGLIEPQMHAGKWKLTNNPEQVWANFSDNIGARLDEFLGGHGLKNAGLAESWKARRPKTEREVLAKRKAAGEPTIEPPPTSEEGKNKRLWEITAGVVKNSNFNNKTVDRTTWIRMSNAIKGNDIVEVGRARSGFFDPLLTWENILTIRRVADAEGLSLD